MNDGSMFANLELFRSKEFWKSHKQISFDTLDRKATYDPQRFSDFVSKCKEMSFYDTGVTAKYGDKLLTLSTCEYTHDNGRLVVVAKRRK